MQAKTGIKWKFTNFVDQHIKFFMTIPPLIILGVIILYPLIEVFHTSFLQTGYMPTKFVGLANYKRILNDPYMRKYLGHSAIYTVGSVLISFALGLTLAVFIDKVKKGSIRTLYISFFLLAWAIPLGVNGLIWRWILNTDWGLLNSILFRTGLISENIPWLSHPTLVWVCTVMVDAWARFPFVLIILYAGLQGIPKELYEAAKVDGATAFQQFRKITLPLLKPSLLVAGLISTMFAFRMFSMVYTLTRGGPGDTTEVFATYIYKTAILRLQQGYAAALSVVLIIVTLIIALVYVRYIMAEVRQEMV